MRILAVDGNNRVASSTHVFLNAHSRKGIPNGAYYGVLNELRALLSHEPHDAIVFVFDDRRPQWRYDLYPDYKGNRSKAGDDDPFYVAYRAQLPNMHEFLTPLGISVLRAPGFEGDDIIGALALELLPEDYELTIFSTDRDYTELVRDNVRLYDPRVKDYVPEDRRHFWKSLIAPKSGDNIKGIHGIGPAKLDPIIQDVFSQYPDQEYEMDIDTFIKALRECDPDGKHKKNANKCLEDYEFRGVKYNGEEVLRRNYKLMSMRYASELCVDCVDCVPGNFDPAAFDVVTKKYEVTALRMEMQNVLSAFRDMEVVEL